MQEKKDGKMIDCYVFFKAVRDDRTTQGNLVFNDKTWIKDDNKFCRDGSCVKGGIYFSSKEFALNFSEEYTTLLKIAVPKNARNKVMDPGGDKARADEIYVIGEYLKC